MTLVAGARSVSLAVLLSAVLLSGCSDPGALHVRVEVREPELGAVRVAALRDPNGEKKAVSSCLLRAGQPSTDDECSLQGGSRLWSGGTEPFELYLYGEPGTVLEISAAGFPKAGTENIVASTSSTATLPGSGEEEQLVLELFSRSRAGVSCDHELEAGGDVNRGALSTFDLLDDSGAQTELIAVAGRKMTFVRFGRQNGCSIDSTSSPVIDTGSCTIDQDALIAGRTANSNETLIVGLCTNAELRAWRVFSDGEITETSTRSGFGRTNVSLPVLADLDGDGEPEVYLIGGASNEAPQLIRWEPGVARRSFVLTDLLTFALDQSAQLPPLVVRDPSVNRDLLIVAGYRRGMVIVTWREVSSTLEPLFLPSEAQNPVPSIGPAAAILPGDPGLTIKVAQLFRPAVASTTIREFVITTLRGAGREWSQQTSMPVSFNLLKDTGYPRTTRFAIGDIDGNGSASAVMVQAGEAFIFSLDDPPMMRRLEVDANSNPYTVLLANIDEYPGAEIIAFDPTQGRIEALNAAGEDRLGWPLDTPSGGMLRVVAGDFDPPGAGSRDLEIVALDETRMRIFSLGPGSFDRSGTPWPMLYYDASARSVLAGETAGP